MNAEVIDKIKKLLRLGTSPNQHEAELAMAKAHEIALNYGIELSKVSADGTEEEMKADFLREGQRLPIAAKFVTPILTKHFNVFMVLAGNRASGRYLYFMGKQSDIDIAKHIYSYLINAMQRGWDVLYKTDSSIKLANKGGYFLGFYYGLDEKLERQKQAAMQAHQSFALMVVSQEDKRKKFAGSYFGKIKAGSTSQNNNSIRKGFNLRAYQQGMEDGTNTTLTKGELANESQG